MRETDSGAPVTRAGVQLPLLGTDLISEEIARLHKEAAQEAEMRRLQGGCSYTTYSRYCTRRVCP